MRALDYVDLHKFVKVKTAIYPGIVSEYWIQAPIYKVRVDYALFHCLAYTNYFKTRTAPNDFGGGSAQNVAIGVELALKKLQVMGDWLNLPSSEYEGMKRVESDFLVFMGDSTEPPRPPADLPKVPIPKEPLPLPSQPIPLPSPTPQPPASGGFWAFVRSLAGILGALNAVMFLLRIWLPGPVVTVLQAVIKFIVDLAAQHPAQATAMIVSTVVASHAVAFKMTPPRVWQRIDKNPN